uniref:Uncharacterized protein n=1 Tax=Anguilla anguilla TaxID=7936 RepID=A0A0E9RGU9_ANGAN
MSVVLRICSLCLCLLAIVVKLHNVTVMFKLKICLNNTYITCFLGYLFRSQAVNQ